MSPYFNIINFLFIDSVHLPKKWREITDMTDNNGTSPVIIITIMRYSFFVCRPNQA